MSFLLLFCCCGASSATMAPKRTPQALSELDKIWLAKCRKSNAGEA
jgi:cellobiose-specific phosphotransferase system component IIB